MLSPHEAESFQRDLIDNQKSPSDREELRQNIAQLKLGEECLLRKRLLGGAGNQDYETYSLPVSRVLPLPYTFITRIKIDINFFSSLPTITAMTHRMLKLQTRRREHPVSLLATPNLRYLCQQNHIRRHMKQLPQPLRLHILRQVRHMALRMTALIKLSS
jgi:hypothetical protein